jgi:hypothetical protein
MLALDACGLREQAAGLLRAVRRHRHDDGSYWTGWQFANEAPFPAERSSWTAAAVVLAADALIGFSSGAAIFRNPLRLSSGKPGPAQVSPIPPVDPEACGCDLASADAVAGSH